MQCGTTLHAVFGVARTAGSFIHPAREPKQKLSRHKRNPNAGNTSAAKPPRAIAPQWGEPSGSSSARQGRQCIKMSRHKRLPNAGNQPTPLKGSPRLGFGVNASREPTGPSSARQGRHIQKNEQAQATPQCRESTDTPKGVPSVGLRRKRLARTAGSFICPVREPKQKNECTLVHSFFCW